MGIIENLAGWRLMDPSPKADRQNILFGLSLNLIPAVWELTNGSVSLAPRRFQGRRMMNRAVGIGVTSAGGSAAYGTFRELQGVDVGLEEYFTNAGALVAVALVVGLIEWGLWKRKIDR